MSDIVIPPNYLGLNVIVRDAAQTIDAMLDSVFRMCAAGYPAFDEYVFVDTGSSDDTRERITKAVQRFVRGRLLAPITNDNDQMVAVAEDMAQCALQAAPGIAAPCFLILGVGNGHVVRELRKRCPDVCLVLVDIDVAALAPWVGVENVTCEPGDARAVVERFVAEERRFDAAVVDVYDAHGTPPQCSTVEFFAALAKLTQTVVVNVLSHKIDSEVRRYCDAASSVFVEWRSFSYGDNDIMVWTRPADTQIRVSEVDPFRDTDFALSWPVSGDAPAVHVMSIANHCVRFVFANFAWVDDFAAARNFSFNLGTATWRGYLDADDVFPDCVKLKPTIRSDEQDPAKAHFNCRVIPYDYANGEMTPEPIRFMRWNENWKWSRPIHEYPKNTVEGRRMIKLADLVVTHRATAEKGVQSLLRNIAICSRVRAQAQAEGNVAVAADMAYYLGRYAMALGKNDEAIAFLSEAAETLRNNHLVLALVDLSRLFIALGRYDDALAAASRIVAYAPHAQEGPALLAMAHRERGDLQTAAVFFAQALAIGRGPIEAARDVVLFDALVPIAAARTFIALGNVKQAQDALTHVPEALRGNEWVKAHPAIHLQLRLASTEIAKATALAIVKQAHDYLIWDTEPAKAVRFLSQCVPAAISDHPAIAALRRQTQSKIAFLKSWDGYKAAYGGLDRDFSDDVAANPNCVPDVDRAREVVKWARSLPVEGKPVRVLSVGPWHACIEAAVLEANPRIHVTCADASEPGAFAAQKLAERYPGRVDFWPVKRSVMDWPDATFDAIFFFEVLEHLPSDHEALIALRSRLAPGGTLFLSTPVADAWIESYLTDPAKAPSFYGHVRAHNPLSLWNVVQDASLTGDIDATDAQSVFFARLKATPRHVTPTRPLAIYLPPSSPRFDPMSLGDGHLGGSEEAVVHLAPELAKRGYAVTVYAPRPERATIVHVRDGVMWRPSSEFDPGADHGTVLVWRSPQIASLLKATKRRLLWLHDTGYGASPADYAAWDRVLVVSHAHERILRQEAGADATNIRVVTNGIAPFPLLTPETEDRDPHLVVYGSSPDRGLDRLIAAWPHVRARDPQARLRIFYGWSGFDRRCANDAGFRAQYGAWAADLKQKIAALASDGVEFIGGVSHERLHAEYRHAGVWAYPTAFYETSCITAMKVQASGCWPIVTSEGALPETVLAGDMISAETATTPALLAAAIVQRTSDDVPSFTARAKMSDKARARFSWSQAADLFDLAIRETE